MLCISRTVTSKAGLIWAIILLFYLDLSVCEVTVARGKSRELLITEQLTVITAKRGAGGTVWGAADVQCAAASAELPEKTSDGRTVSLCVMKRLQAVMELLSNAK